MLCSPASLQLLAELRVATQTLLSLRQCPRPLWEGSSRALVLPNRMRCAAGHKAATPHLGAVRQDRGGGAARGAALVVRDGAVAGRGLGAHEAVDAAVQPAAHASQHAAAQAAHCDAVRLHRRSANQFAVTSSCCVHFRLDFQQHSVDQHENLHNTQRIQWCGSPCMT